MGSNRCRSQFSCSVGMHSSTEGVFPTMAQRLRTRSENLWLVQRATWKT